jgi:hypothetical protein
MRSLLVCFVAAAGCLQGQPSALDIVKRSIDLDVRNYRRAKDYTYQQREVFRELDGGGRAKSTTSHVYDVLMVYGRPYNRLIEKDGKPLDPAAQAKQEERLRKVMEKRRKESEDANSKEGRDHEKHRAEQRKFLSELPEAYTFTLAGEETVSGKPACIVGAEPKPGYKPRDPRAKMFTKIHGKLWIDKGEYQWVKLEAETTDTISFGLFLARLWKGSTFRFEQRRVNDEVWLPSHMEIGMEGRLALVKKMRAGVEITYANYKKFQTDSRVLSTSETLP